MRLLLKLESVKGVAYDQLYFHKLQGFVYNLIRESPFSAVHDKAGYKHFCFSNIFPFGDIAEGDKRSLLISSPSSPFIKFLLDKLTQMKEGGSEINIGEMAFKIESLAMFQPKIYDGCMISCATPVVLRIPEDKYDDYAIPAEKRKSGYIYWRPEVDFNAFVKQLTENIFKKYGDFYKEKIDPFPLFEQYKFVRSVCNHVVIDGKEYKLVGSLWDFMFTRLGAEQRKMLGFAIDSGFGERNSYGFGFMNVR